MRALETGIEHKACSEARKLGVLSWKLTIAGETGIPDRLFLIPGGRPLLIEFKRPGESPRPKQKWWIDLLKKLGYQVEVHDDADAALRSISRALEAARVPEKSDKVSAGARLRRPSS